MATKTLEDAIILSVEAHRGQLDKGHNPYILHCLRVMLAQNSNIQMMIAILHDAVEDGGITLQDLAGQGYPNEVVKGVKAMTRNENQSYEEYLKIIMENDTVIPVKIADVRDNFSPARLMHLDVNTVQRLTKKYTKALQVLLKLNQN